jgi:hypothetical protein
LAAYAVAGFALQAGMGSVFAMGRDAVDELPELRPYRPGSTPAPRTSGSLSDPSMPPRIGVMARRWATPDQRE